MIQPTDFRFFLDSGAFSAWSRGAVIDIDEYIAFIRTNIDRIEVYANLDVLPGKFGDFVTPAMREEAAKASWDNFMYMRSEGLHPLPVFHAMEDWKWLDKMLEMGCDYIGLGGLVGLDSDVRKRWLDQVFDRITDAEGRPLVKTHGFGMTSIPLIFRYPWHSVDSTTWIKITANGGVYLPAVRGGNFVFDEIPTTVTVSGKNPKQQIGGKAANTMSPAMRAILDRWLAECGKTYEEVAGEYYHRAVCNVTFFRKVSELAAVKPFVRDAIRQSTMWED